MNTLVGAFTFGLEVVLPTDVTSGSSMAAPSRCSTNSWAAGHIASNKDESQPKSVQRRR